MPRTMSHGDPFTDANQWLQTVRFRQERSLSHREESFLRHYSLGPATKTKTLNKSWAFEEEEEEDEGDSDDGQL